MKWLAKKVGLGCWCCGHYGSNVMFRQRLFVKRHKYDLTWCTECKFAACEVCA